MFPRPINPTLFVEKAEVWKADASLADLLAIVRTDALNILQLLAVFQYGGEQVYAFLVALPCDGKGGADTSQQTYHRFHSSLSFSSQQHLIKIHQLQMYKKEQL